MTDTSTWIEHGRGGAEWADPVGAGVYTVPVARNEPVLRYAAGSPERLRLDKALRDLRAARAELTPVIGGERVFTGEVLEATMPHDRRHVLADVHQAGAADVERAIGAAREAWQDWHRWPWTERAGVFLRAAALVAGPYRERLVAATMLDQSKTVSEAEADAACELADFLRFNVANLRRVLEEQPESGADAWNRTEYRPLEGFIYAITPFNFTAIGANLPTTPALLGNTVIWKPSAAAMVGASLVMEVLEEAGLPPGVINLVYGDPAEVSEIVLSSPHLAGVHFTGSTEVFRGIWNTVGRNMTRYRGFPRLVGETGGKDFVLVHPSADVDVVATALVRGAFEYQGQKCSAASRLYAPASMWPAISERLIEAIGQIRMGDVADPGTYVGAVINQVAFERHRQAIEHARTTAGAAILAGGQASDDQGWFVTPTVIETRDPAFPLLRKELFGPVLTAFVYDDDRWDETLGLVDETSEYALTGSIISRRREPMIEAASRLRYAAGNLYLNDKPTGSVVGQQPFGGSRASGTNDKTATAFHLTRWMTARTIKDNHVPQTAVPFPRNGSQRQGG
ncbi:MAG: 1-pyrroline-5-carboxylate dehydrogenase [Gaiellales bacterium]|nr:1-pyrroline-5-carboxylate dehydrogenase [Gaiellales bacterium]